ncbi:MAG: tetraacyldisaccharide 4'-kinase, partial [Flavobacteriales bacterium]|nr:tetraacyldisaccharide 4'-kinase [Flavobacteriales bacterium]
MPWYRHFLWLFAILYGSVVWMRNRLFDFGILPSRKFNIPIICVGNLEAGGTGKSPLVMYLVKLMHSNGIEVATLSLGYGRKTTGFILADENSSVSEIGDEAKQLKTRFRDVPVAVCENRVEGVKSLMDSPQKPEVIIMDDGFQHRWMKPSLSILTTSGTFPFWKNHLLPVGTLRESREEVKRADILIVPNTRGGEASSHFNGSIFSTETKWKDPIRIHGSEDGLQDLKKKKVILLSGIGNPRRFENTAGKLFDVVDHVTYSDHHVYTQTEFKSLRKKLDRYGAAVSGVLTTEKDAMRLMGSPVLNELGQSAVFYLPIDVSITGEEEQKFNQ